MLVHCLREVSEAPETGSRWLRVFLARYGSLKGGGGSKGQPKGNATWQGPFGCEGQQKGSSIWSEGSKANSPKGRLEESLVGNHLFEVSFLEVQRGIMGSLRLDKQHLDGLSGKASFSTEMIQRHSVLPPVFIRFSLRGSLEAIGRVRNQTWDWG